MHPVLFVHGINDTGANFGKLMKALRSHGAQHLEAIDLRPNDGSATIRELAEQVHAAALRLLEQSGAQKLDVVGFSMGSLVTRYWIQRLGGRALARRFASISGPHAGTWLAHLLSRPGILEMRPDSPLLRELEADPDPWGEVEVHVLWTPLDLTIVPARSALLTGAHSVRSFPVVLHPLMLSDRRVIAAICELCAAP